MIETLISLLAPLEMLAVNLFVIDRCSQRKYSSFVTVGIMGLFSVAIVGLSSLLNQQLSNFGDGSGFFVFFGFLFLIPAKILYENSVAKIICLACTSWVYTFLLFSLSVHLGNMIAGVSGIPLIYIVAVVQTLLYVLTLVWFYRTLRDKFLPMLAQLSVSQTRTLMWMSIIWFWTVFIVNLVFIYPEFYLFRIFAILSVAICAYISYRYIYQLIHTARTIQTLEHMAYHDDLTQLRSRVVLSKDIEDLIGRDIPFRLFFIDLDDFKTINDNYGHHVGDEYLAFFARQVKLRLGEQGGFYRIAGDEFVCLFTAPDIESFLQSLSAIPETLPDSDVEFKGFSYGISAFPDDGKNIDTLLRIADSRMYDMKNARRERSE